MNWKLDKAKKRKKGKITQKLLDLGENLRTVSSLVDGIKDVKIESSKPIASMEPGEQIISERHRRPGRYEIEFDKIRRGGIPPADLMEVIWE